MTAELTTAEAVARTAQPVLEFARGWLLAKETIERGAELGLPPGRAFWVVGRGGVLGDVDADVVAAGVGFMHPDALRPIWEARRADIPAREYAAAYAGCCFHWAQGALASVPERDLVRLAELVRRVNAHAVAPMGALFAGWRAMPVPADDPAGAVALVLHVLRELRGGAHITAVLAAGMSPVDALMSAPPPRGGEGWASDLGWAGPFPLPETLGERRAHAEALTSTLCQPAFEALSPAERGELVDLIVAARAALG